MFSWQVPQANAVPVRASVAPVSAPRITLQPNGITPSKRRAERNARCAHSARTRASVRALCATNRVSRGFTSRSLRRAGERLKSDGVHGEPLEPWRLSGSRIKREASVVCSGFRVSRHDAKFRQVCHDSEGSRGRLWRR
jgi:hypothetical protein